MAKPVAVHRGVLKELGPAIVDTSSAVPSTTYTFIEFVDGTLLRKIAVVGGLDGKLDGAMESKEPVELHVQPAPKNSFLLAIKVGSDRLFATEISGNLFVLYGIFLILVALGIATIWVFGLGLLFLGFAAWVWMAISNVRSARRYVRALPNAALL
jgi:hypothetical protein